MFKKLLIFMTLLIVAGSSFAQSYPALNGVQVFVLDEKYDGNIDELFTGLKDHGVDSVFIRVFHNGIDRYHYRDVNEDCKSGVYFKTDSACMVRDVLGEAVTSARKHGMKIFAWMATRSLTFLKTPEYMEKEFRKEGLADGYGMSIFNEEASETVRQLFRDLAKYDIDGILFQDDFILRYREGASDYALNAYRADTGIDLSFDKLFGCTGGLGETKVPGGCPDTFIPWTEWKNGKMMEFYQSLKIAAMQENPDLVIAGNVYYETPLEETKGMSWYAQSISSMLAYGFDYLAVMGYHDQIAGELNLNREQALKMVEQIADNLKKTVEPTTRILMKVQRISFSNSGKLGDEHIESICDMLAKYICISRVVVPVNRVEDLSGTCLGN
ncbi:MAG: poly-beta-1,6-N-acetyl-D-glucosamine N-deacetylase PgaB [Deferribacterales bacterium]